MTLTTSTRARAASSAPRISFRRSILLQDPRQAPRPTPQPSWIGSLVVPR